MTLIHKTIVVLALSVVFFSCESEPEQADPADVFSSFLTHYFRGEPELAFEFVDPADRDALQEPLKNAPSQGEPLKPWEMLVVAEVENVYDVANIITIQKFNGTEADGVKATLTIQRTDGSEAEASMVKRNGRWYVDLPLETVGQQG